MKKLTLLVQQKDASSALRQLRALGVVHIEHQQQPKGKDIGRIQEDIAFIGEAITILDEHHPEALPCMDLATEPIDWHLTAKHLVELHKRLDQLQEYSKAIVHQISQWSPWGDFDPEQVRSLARQSIYLRLYCMPEKELKNIPSGIMIERIVSERGMVYCVLISRQRTDIPYKEMELPKIRLSRMKARLAEDAKMIQELQRDIRKYICARDKLVQIKQSLEKELEFQEALSGMGQEKTIVFLRGFIPCDVEDTLLQIARREKWGIAVDAPGEDENVPTLVRNPRWITMINPVFKLLEILPGYRELDVSLMFLIFFSVFFGILIGDAGYGAAYLGLTLFMQRKMGRKAKDKTVFFLFYLLSFCAIIWGLLTGSIFGQAWLVKTGIKPLLPALNDPKFMQAFCFFLGALHLSIAHGWRAALKLPSLSALADLGWICVLWSAFIFAKMLILGDTLPFFAKWMLFTGMGLVVFFTNPQKNILKGVGEGLGTLALSLMNNFTDVVSYVRLFAVGMAGVAIAETCNTMAGSLGNGGIIFTLASVLILVIGHALNIVLGPMSVLVHGVRLNVLEFSSHASITWSGQPYRPLKQ